MDLPKESRKILLLRCCFGTVGFTTLVYGVKILPLFIGQIIYNTSPFWTSILGYYVLNDTVSKIEIICMIGCFLGVISLATAKSGIFEEE